MKYTYTGCLHFVSAKQLLHLSPRNNSRNKTCQQRGKKVKAAFWPSHRETRSLGQGERGEIQFPVSLPSQCGSLNNHHQLLPTCWMLAKQGKTATHILSFPSCSPVFHMSKQAGNSETHKNEITTLRSKMGDYHTESKTLLTHCSVTPFPTCTGKSHTKQLPGGEFFSGA